VNEVGTQRMRCLLCGYCEKEDLRQPAPVVREIGRTYQRCGACCTQTHHRIEEIVRL
jgi:hypothetical protein